MPLIVRDWVVTGLLAATFIYVLKMMTLTTGLKNVPGMAQFTASI